MQGLLAGNRDVAAQRGVQLVDAGELDARLRPVFDFLGVESNPTPVKAILELQGIGHGLRLPLMPLSAEHRDAAVQIAATADALEHACLRARQ